jgi:hypothetical protein
MLTILLGTSVTLPASANIGTPWLIVDTSSSGTPTYVRAGSAATLTLASTSEVENVCLAHGDSLAFDIDDIQRVVMRVKIGASTLLAVASWCLVLVQHAMTLRRCVAANAWFKMVGANSTTAVYVETDDGTRDNNDVATGATLGTSYKEFVIDFTGGKSNVKFYIDGARVAASTTFDMSGYSSGLQPISPVAKAANTNTDAVSIDYVEIACKRRAA